MARKSDRFYAEYPDGSVSRAVTSEEIHKERSLAEVETHGPETKNGTVINSLHVNVRTKPSLDSDVVEVLRKGDVVTIIGRKGDFYKITNEAGRIAYISSDFIQEE